MIFFMYVHSVDANGSTGENQLLVIHLLNVNGAETKVHITISREKRYVAYVEKSLNLIT